MPTLHADKMQKVKKFLSKLKKKKYPFQDTSDFLTPFTLEKVFQTYILNLKKRFILPSLLIRLLFRNPLRQVYLIRILLHYP